MAERMRVKLGMGVGMALATALILSSIQEAKADLGEAVSFTEPRHVLVMPFDVTDNHESFQLVSRIGTEGGAVVATHWSYWAKDCEHLADVFICLTNNDTVVVDPRNLQSEVQSLSPPENHKIGPKITLSGVQGMVTVSAFAGDAGPGGLGCQIIDPDSDRVGEELVGSWTIADTATDAAFGNDAIGLNVDEVPDSSLMEGGIYIQTFNPQTLGDSDVILFGVETALGNGRFEDVEIGPIRGRGTPSVCCDVSFTDNLEITISLPDVCFDCVHFAPIASNLGPNSIVPASATVDSSGFVTLANCSTFPLSPDDCEGGRRCPPSVHGLEQFIFGFHGQAVGPYGSVVTAKYFGECPDLIGTESLPFCPPPR